MAMMVVTMVWSSASVSMLRTNEMSILIWSAANPRRFARLVTRLRSWLLTGLIQELANRLILVGDELADSFLLLFGQDRRNLIPQLGRLD